MEFFSHILVCMCLIKVSRVVPSYSLDPVRMASSIQWKNMMSYTIRASLVAQMVRKWSEVKSLSHVRHFATPWTTCSLPGSSVHGIFQAIVLEWIAISFPRGSSQPRDWTRVSCFVDRRLTVWATREVCLQFRSPGFDTWVRKIPWRRKWQSTPVLLPGKSHGQRSLVGYM